MKDAGLLGDLATSVAKGFAEVGRMWSGKKLGDLATSAAKGFAEVGQRLDNLNNDIGILAQRYEIHLGMVTRDLGMVTRDLGIVAGQIEQLGAHIDSLSKTTAKELTYLSVNSAQLWPKSRETIHGRVQNPQTRKRQPRRRSQSMWSTV